MKITPKVILFIIVSLFTSLGCTKEGATPEISVPTLTTKSISNILATSAVSGGNITSDGGAAITTRGIVWGTNSNLTIDLSTKTTDGSGSGYYSSNLTELVENTTYYVRAYATNSVGTAYGNEITFKAFSPFVALETSLTNKDDPIQYAGSIHSYC
jgi:hypothetical protein